MDLLDIFYGRVSTELKTQDTSEKRQFEIGEAGGYDLVLIDRESGRNISRAEYTKLIDLIRDGRVRSVTATTSHRIGRDAAEMDYFYKLCTKYDVEWIYLDEPLLNSDSAFGHTQRKQAAHEAEMESIKLGLRQASAYRHAEAKGRVIARTVPIGLRVTAEKKFEVDWLLPDASNAIAIEKGQALASGEIARRLVDLFFENETIFHSHKQWREWLSRIEPIDEKKLNRLKKFRYASAKEWLTNPAVRGNMAYGKYEKYYEENQSSRTITAKYRSAPKEKWRIVYETHVGLIDKSEAKEIDRIIALNQSFGFALQAVVRDPSLPMSLSPILRCECGHAVNLSSNRYGEKVYRYYYCSLRHECNSKRAIEREIVDQIIRRIGQQAEQLLGAIDSAISSESAQESEELRKLRHERDKAIDSFKSTGMSVFLDAEKQLSERIGALENMGNGIVNLDESSQQVLSAIKDPEFWWTMQPCDRHSWFRKIVRVARLQGGQVVSVELSL